MKQFFGDFFVVPIFDVTFWAGGGRMFSFAPRAVLPQTPDYPVASEDIVRSLKDARKQDKTASEVPQWLEAQPARDEMGILSTFLNARFFME